MENVQIESASWTHCVNVQLFCTSTKAQNSKVFFLSVQSRSGGQGNPKPMAANPLSAEGQFEQALESTGAPSVP